MIAFLLNVSHSFETYEKRYKETFLFKRSPQKPFLISKLVVEAIN